jgi:hypothetical protein
LSIWSWLVVVVEVETILEAAAEQVDLEQEPDFP